MKTKWKDNKKLKPRVILNKIDSIKTVDESKKLSFSGFEYFDAMATLQSMVEFPKTIDKLNQSSIISKAVSNIAKDSDLDEAKIIDEINLIVKKQLATREYKYHVLSSISLGIPLPR